MVYRYHTTDARQFDLNNLEMLTNAQIVRLVRYPPTHLRYGLDHVIH